MDDSSRQRWLSTAILVGALYLAVAIASGALAGAAASNQMQFFWRLSAFVISAVVFAAHIAYEHFGLRNTAWPTAWHASVAVAFGAFGLALVANIHDLGSAGLSTPNAHRLRSLAPSDRCASVYCRPSGGRWREAAGCLGEQTVACGLSACSGPESVSLIDNLSHNAVVARPLERGVMWLRLEVIWIKLENVELKS